MPARITAPRAGILCASRSRSVLAVVLASAADVECSPTICDGSTSGGSRMRRLVPVLLTVVVVMSASNALASTSGAASATGTAASYIVVFKKTVTNPGAVATAQGRAHGFQARFVYSHALKGYAASLSPAEVSTIAADPNVSYVVPDAPVHAAAFPCAAPLISQQCLPNWAHRIDAQQSSTRSDDGTGTVNINVAVVDSGIDVTHPDLNVVGGVNCSNGHSFADAFGHGTAVAGIIGAKDNTFGVVGVAPGANLWSVRVLNNKNTGSESSILCGIDWVTGTRTDTDPANDIAVANMSLGGNGKGDDGNCGFTRQDTMHKAICASVAAGVTYVVAAGNDAADFRNTRPAAYHEVLTATAMDDTDGTPGGLTPPSPSGCGQHTGDDVFASFSDFATLPADLAHTVAAPGVCDLTTARLAACATSANPQPTQCYTTGTGTSFASPAVAGTVALCIAQGPCAGLTPAQIIQKMVADAQTYNTANPGYGFTGDPIRPVTGKYYGYLIHAGSY